MNKSLKKILICLCVMLSCMTLFLSVGYAKITGHLEISGTAKWNESAAVIIKSIKITNSANVTGNATVNKTGFTVFEFQDCVLKAQGNSQSSPGGSVTLEIMILNNSGVSQYFTGHTVTPTPANTTAITYSGIKVGELLQHGATRTFTITLQNTSRWSTAKLTDAEFFLNFSPNFDEDFTEGASQGVAEVFMYVLSGLGIDGEGTGITYKGRYIEANKIVETLTQNMENVDTGGYMGNVGNASQDQKDLIAAIFGENISMQIGNQVYSVSLLIKNQQIDGKGQNDMVIYVTADQLAVGGGRWNRNQWTELNVVPVYGIVYINNGNGKYTQCEHVFAGEAPVCDFGGALGTDKVGNFNTNLWNSTDYADLQDTSGGSISQSYITTNGELDEAYQRYIKENP